MAFKCDEINVVLHTNKLTNDEPFRLELSRCLVFQTTRVLKQRVDSVLCMNASTFQLVDQDNSILLRKADVVNVSTKKKKRNEKKNKRNETKKSKMKRKKTK